MAERKKILYVITKGSWGGAQKYVYDLACAAQERGYEVAVAYGLPAQAGEAGLLVDRLAEAQIRTIPLGSLTRDIGTGRELNAFGALMGVLRAERPDIVHLNSSKAGGLGCLAARLAGIPRIIFTAHGWAFNESRPWWQKVLIWKLAGLTVWLSHTTICVSQAIARDIESFPCTKRKLIVIHNGIACADLRARADARARLLPAQAGLPTHENEYWIGMVSELHATKRVEDAILGFQKIAPHYPNALLVVIGEGSERAKLKAVIRKLDLENRVHLAGFVANASEYVAAFDLFLHTSQSEAFAYSILEAGCATLPVVATKVGGIPEIIENEKTGLLVPLRSTDAVAIALAQLIENPTFAAQLGSALHARVLTDFSLSQMLQTTVLVYH